MKLLLNLGLFVSSATTAAAVAAVDPHAAEELSAADQRQFEKEHASNAKLIDGALLSSMFVQVNAKLAAMESKYATIESELAATKAKHAAELTATKSELTAVKSEHAAELTAVKSDMKSKVADLKATIASLKARRHGAAPSSLRRRTTQEFSMSTPAIANIEQEAFWGGWDYHHESCCDRVAVLEGKVTKLEDEVDDLNKCSTYDKYYKLDDDGASKETCRYGLGVSQVAIEATDRVHTRTDTTIGRITHDSLDFEADAQGSVMVMAKTTAKIEAQDIVLDSKNDIMAHAMNNIQIKAKEDVEITADANGGSEGNVKISGENVHVDAVDDVKVAGDNIHVNAKTSVAIMAEVDVDVHADNNAAVKANNNVTLNAAIDGSADGNVIIEGVKYFPQKNEICSSDSNKMIGVRIKARGFRGPPEEFNMTYDYPDLSQLPPIVDVPGVNSYSASKIELEDVEGHLDFGNITVGNGPADVVVDVVATTGGFYFTGNDDYFESNLTDTAGDNDDHGLGNWNSINGARVSLEVELRPVGGGQIVYPVPNTPITLSAFQDVFALDQDSWDADDDAFFFQKNETSTHPAKLIFSEVPPGNYDVKVRMFLDVETELQLELDDRPRVICPNDDCCDSKGSAGCSDSTCEALVCANYDSSCCNTQWAYFCGVYALNFCENEKQLDVAAKLEYAAVTVDTKVELGPHVISVSVIDASHDQCDAIAWPPTQAPTTEAPTSE